MLQILRLRRIRMVIGKAPVHFEEKFGRVAIQLFESTAEHQARRAVPCIGYDFDAARQFELRHNLIGNKGVIMSKVSSRTRAVLEIGCFNQHNGSSEFSSP